MNAVFTSNVYMRYSGHTDLHMCHSYLIMIKNYSKIYREQKEIQDR